MVEPQLPSENILNSYVAVLRQMSNARTAIEEKCWHVSWIFYQARDVHQLFTPYLGAALGIGSARIDGRFARASKSIPRRFWRGDRRHA